MSSDQTQTVGAALPHESAYKHVTGQAQYVDDIPLPDHSLFVAVGASTCALGQITRLDLSAVYQAPGVVDVIVASDIPGDIDVGAVFPGDPLLTSDRVEFIGQPIFAVAADSQVAAQRACALAKIEYAVETPVLDVSEALAKENFVLPPRHWINGDATGAIDQADQHLDTTLYIRGQEHFYLEGQVAYAQPKEDGMFVCISSQHPAEVQKLVARVLDCAMHKVQVECRRMGGGFGGKESQAAPLACLAAVFATRTGRTVKYRMSRRDDMVQTGKRHDFQITSRLGFDNNGVLTAGAFQVVGKCGYSPDLSEGIVDRAMYHIDNAYYLAQTEIHGYCCKTNTVSNTAFRGFGGPQGMLAIEAAMDEIAYQVDVDPLELRKRNFYRAERDVTPYGQTITQHVLADLVSQLEKDCDYWARRDAIKQANATSIYLKRGLALNPVKFGISFTTTHLNQAGALVHIFTDGSVEVSHAGTEMGQGLYTKIAQVVAQEFGIPRSQVINAATRTDKVPNGSPTAASSAADMNGMAAVNACHKIKAELQAFAEEEMNWSGTLIFADGRVGTQTQGMAVTFQEFVKTAYMGRVHLSATGFYRTPDIHMDKVAGRGNPFYYFAYGAAASEVEIDTRTGAYKVLRTDILHDVGASLNPAIDIGQIEGGFIQGMGWLTTEELLWDNTGRVISNGPANYKIPAASDCPPILNVSLFDAANSVATVHRSKAVGEPPVMLAISVWCALRDACASVSNYRYLPKLAVPATPEQVYYAAKAARAYAETDGA